MFAIRSYYTYNASREPIALTSLQPDRRFMNSSAQELLADNPCVGFIGPSGVGKTILSRRLVHHGRGVVHDVDRVIWGLTLSEALNEDLLRRLRTAAPDLAELVTRGSITY